MAIPGLQEARRRVRICVIYCLLSGMFKSAEHTFWRGPELTHPLASSSSQDDAFGGPSDSGWGPAVAPRDGWGVWWMPASDPTVHSLTVMIFSRVTTRPGGSFQQESPPCNNLHLKLSWGRCGRPGPRQLRRSSAPTL